MSKKPRKRKSTSVIAMCITGGLFLGLGMGALMNNLLPVLLVCVVVSAGIGYYIDKKNRIAYTQKSS